MKIKSKPLLWSQIKRFIKKLTNFDRKKKRNHENSTNIFAPHALPEHLIFLNPTKSFNISDVVSVMNTESTNEPHHKRIH